jgi:hypothetical protein
VYLRHNLSATNPIADPSSAIKWEGDKMPEETIPQTQTPAENQNGEGTVVAPETQQGGPSDEFKMKRLEQERNEIAEKLQRLEAKRKAQEEASLTPEERFTSEQESFYRDKTSETITKELSKEIEKLPKPLQDRIKADPFNTAWLDEKTLEFELYGVNAEDPKAKYEAVKKAALKSIPEFVAGFGTEAAPAAKQEESFGTNPPVSQGNAMTGGRDYAQMSDDELRKLSAAMKGSII